MFRDTALQDRPIQPTSAWQRHPRTLAIIAAAAIAVTLLVVAIVRSIGIGASVDRSALTIATVQRGPFVRDVAADGNVVSAGSPTLYAPLGGLVALKVRAGDSVVKDQIVAEVDSPDLAARLSQEEATLQSLRIEWQRAKLEGEHLLGQARAAREKAAVDRETAQRELERSRRAFELGAYPEVQVLRAEDALKKAQFEFEQATRELAAQPARNRFNIESRHELHNGQQILVTELRRQLAAAQVRAPVDGQVGQVHVADRASVAKDVPLMSVVDLSVLEVEIKVPEGQARDIVRGMPADLQVGGRNFDGVVAAISPQIVNGAVAARLHFGADRPAALRQNQRVSVRIVLDRRDDVLSVERGSFIDQEGGGYAYVVRDSVAERTPIRVGAMSLSRVEILGGLAEGDAVVVSGAEAFAGADRIALSD